uniref:Uncharacterized protein n=1 Tax=Macrostomum lignano TaxID=282301 RepID=A0A1I8FRB2_9PLAT
MMKEFADSAEAAGPPGPPKQSDNESVRTEDFANKFSQLMQPEGSTAGSKSRPGVGGDAESIRTEDFAREFRKTLVPPAGGTLYQAAAAAAAVPPPPPASWRAAGFPSADAESVSLTADTEHRLLPRSQRHLWWPSTIPTSLRAAAGLATAVAAAAAAGWELPHLDSSSGASSLDSADRRLQELLLARQQKGLWWSGIGDSSTSTMIFQFLGLTNDTLIRRHVQAPRVTGTPRHPAVSSLDDQPAAVADKTWWRRAAERANLPDRVRPQPRSLPGDEPEMHLLADDEFANEVPTSPGDPARRSSRSGRRRPPEAQPRAERVRASPHRAQ